MQQSSISSFFAKKKSSTNLKAAEPLHSSREVICIDSDENVESDRLDEIAMDFQPSKERSTRFQSAVLSAFDGVAQDSYESGSGGRGNLSSSNGKEPRAGPKKASKKGDTFTPLERQVLEVKKEHPDALLMIECGYRLRFFDEDATNAAKVLSIHAHKDHNFMVASVPTHRFLVHARRLVAAGYRVGLVRQTETAAIHSKTKSSSKTFDRSCVALYTPGVAIDDDDPAFVDMILQSKKGDPSEDDELNGTLNEAEAEGLQGAELEGIDDEPSLSFIANNANLNATMVLSLQLRAGVLRHRLLHGETHLREQEATDYLDTLRPAEILSDTTMSLSFWSALVERCKGVVAVDRSVEKEESLGSAAAALPNAYVIRLSKVPSPVPDASSLTLAVLPSSLAKTSAYQAFEKYLKSLMLEVDLGDLRHCCDDPAPGAAWAREATISNDENNEQEVEGDKEAVVGRDSEGPCFLLDPVTARDLEVFAADTDLVPNGGAIMPSLLQEMNHCCSAFGKRTLRSWLAAPLTSVEGIQCRQRAVVWLRGALKDTPAGQAKSFMRSNVLAKKNGGTERIPPTRVKWLISVENTLKTGTSGIERWLCALKSGKLSPANLIALLQWTGRLGDLAPPQALLSPIDSDSEGSSSVFPDLLLSSLQPRALHQVAKEATRLLDHLRSGATVDWSNATDGSVMASLGDNVLEGFEDLRLKCTKVTKYEEQMQEHLQDARRILRDPQLQFRTLHTGAGSCIEHLIEVNSKIVAANSSLIPKDWVSVNSTKMAIRYHPPEILRTQQELVLARDELASAARSAWKEFLLLQVSPGLFKQLQEVVVGLGVVDALLSLAKLALRPGYICPQFASALEESIDNDTISLKQARHPVAERLLEVSGEGQFQPNDVTLRCNFRERSCLVLTGPNMGGKSTYVRMVSVLCLMGQIGSYIPAESAMLPIFDNIFTRMGAGDDLAAGRSTFATELFRANAILRRATHRSLVILDELGRGTSTNDGVCIAMAALKHLVDKVGCAMIFVTHYAQIADMVVGHRVAGTSLQGKALNIHMGYLESDQQEQDEPQVLFLYQAVEGASKGSFGLNVARLAGLSGDMLMRAEQKAEWMRRKLMNKYIPDSADIAKNVDQKSEQGKRKRDDEIGAWGDEELKQGDDATGSNAAQGNHLGEEVQDRGRGEDEVENERKKLQRLIEDSQRRLEQLTEVRISDDNPQVHGRHAADRAGDAEQWKGLVLSGNIKEATELLGYCPYLTGIVVHGEKRGRTIGYPTANLGVDLERSDNVIPCDGVYAGWLTVDGKKLQAAISIGTNPTFEGVRSRQVEAYALRQDSWIDLYDKIASVTFKERLRDTVKYDGANWLDQLLQQMAKDCDRAWELTREID